MNPWVAAARPRTLPAAIAPVLVGSGLAAADGVYRNDSFALALVSALAIQVAANYANDASDAHRGADTEDRVGPTRMVATGAVTSRAMWIATALALSVSALAGLGLVFIAGWPIVIIGLVSILAMLTYVGGPIPYGYRGFGELAVFVFFGLVATVGTRYAHGGTTPGVDAWILGCVMGMLAAAILVANNLRDLATDRRVGKRTLAVMLGRDRTRSLYRALVLGAFVVIVVAAVVGATPPLTGIAALWVWLAAKPIAVVMTAEDPTALLPVLGDTARIQLLVGISLGMAAAFS